MNLRFMGVSALAVMVAAGPALAQRTPLFQNGQALPNDVLKSTTQGLATSAGDVDGDTNGQGVNPFGITDNNDRGVCSHNASTGGTHSSICIGHDEDGRPHILVTGNTDKPLRVTDNGDEVLLSSTITGIPVAATMAALGLLSTADHRNVLRAGYHTRGDSPGLTFTASDAPCTANAGAGDGGSQVPSANGNCWVIPSASDGVDIRQFGAGTGQSASVNQAAIQNAIVFAQFNKVNVVIPPGTYDFNAAFTCPASSNWGIIGAGGYVSQLRYTGAGTNLDMLKCGDLLTNSEQVAFKGFRIFSDTVMTGGHAFRPIRMVKPRIDDLVLDGEYGNGRLWHAGYAEWTVNGGQYSNIDFRGNSVGGTAFKVAYGADLALFGNNRMRHSRVGMHIGSGIGGLQCISADIIQNGTNIIIDNSLVDNTNIPGLGVRPELNREIFIHAACLADSATVDDNIVVNETSSGAARTLEIHGYIAGAVGHGINIVSWPDSYVSVRARVWGNGASGLALADASTGVTIEPASQLVGNDDYGIYCEDPMTLFGSVIPRQNVAGQIHSNCVLQTGGGFAAGVANVSRNAAPQVYDTGLVAGGVLRRSFINDTDAINSTSEFVVNTGIANNFVALVATNGTGAGPFAQLSVGAGATQGLVIAAAAGPIRFETAPVRYAVKTVAALGACATGNAGDTYWVTDLASASFGATAVGGGTTQRPVQCNGANWVQ